MIKPSHYSIKGLYAVTPDILEVDLLCEKVRKTLEGGASLVQYRNKFADKHLLLQQSTALLALCRSYQVPLIINDHLDLCAQINADGLHIGATDCDLHAARRLLGPDKIIGASCYNWLELAVQAEAAGASYVAFGACFPSETKPNAVHAPLTIFKEARHKMSLPMVAIGGIHIDNAQQVIDAGADALAVITDIFLDDDIQHITQRYTQLFQPIH
ncbi:MAG: thiamine-phosphate diphosphorylase [Methylophilales bacterium 16-45-7]|jgi:thiamine-phosphate pyrophosphorylase|nr:MAG: thiamine-phosphate diphosphorylase [Methylophilales bacterium 16-45-7]